MASPTGSSRPAGDPALEAEIALQGLLDGRLARLQQPLRERIGALRAQAELHSPQERAADRNHVHQLRTGLRRLRSLADAFPALWHGPKPAALRRLARCAGKVRDLDVLLESLAEPRLPIGAAERQRLEQLIRRLQKRRARARRKLLRSLERPSRGLLGPPGQGAAAAGPGRTDADRAALPLLRASLIAQLAGLRLHRGWGHGERPSPGSRQEGQQHELRKAFKRFRYQLELLEELEPDLRDRLPLLKRTQDSLGRLQDLVTWPGLLKRHRKGGSSQRLPDLSAHWRRQGDAAWADWCELRRRWLDPATGLEAWQRWLLELESPAGQ